MFISLFNEYSYYALTCCEKYYHIFMRTFFIYLIGLPLVKYSYTMLENCSMLR
jgi:hypothetical protein